MLSLIELKQGALENLTEHLVKSEEKYYHWHNGDQKMTCCKLRM